LPQGLDIQSQGCDATQARNDDTTLHSTTDNRPQSQACCFSM
jgi:hypothetical protein